MNEQNDIIPPPRGRRPNPTPVPVRRAMSDVGTHLSTWRRLRRLTQAQVAERAQISLSTLVALEEGTGGTRLENLLRVARVLGTMDSLVTALDPYETDVGRLRSDEHLPARVRTPRAPRSSPGAEGTPG